MSKKLEPSPARKTAVTIAAGLATIAFFVLLFGASYIIFPSSNSSHPSTSIQLLNQSNPAQEANSSSTGHQHAALMVSVKDEPLDFSDKRYQNQNLLVHFENGDGFTLHKHDRRAWLGQFLESLNITLAGNCLTLANGSSYCSNFDNQIMFFVNGVPNSEFQHYIPRDADRILISYGKAEEAVAQLDRLNSIIIKP